MQGSATMTSAGVLTRTTAGGPDHPGRTAGPTFEMYYQFGNFVPWRQPAWALLSERATILATRSTEAAALPGAPAAVNDAATAAADIAAQLLAHVPEQLRHVRLSGHTDHDG